MIATRRALRRTSPLSLEIPASPLPHIADMPAAVRAMKARVVRADSKESYSLYALRFSRALL